MIRKYSDDQTTALRTVLNEAIKEGDWDRLVWILGEEVRHNSPSSMRGYSSGRSRLLEDLAQGKNAGFGKVADVLNMLGIKLTLSPKTL